jgi:hypothetical protein
LRLRREFDHSNFLFLPRLEPILAQVYARDLRRECQTENDVQWEYSDAEKSALYPTPLSLFGTHPFVGEPDEGGSEQVQVAEAELATRYSQDEKLELRHAQLAHRNLFQLQTMLHWDGDGPRPEPHMVCWCAACVTAKAHKIGPRTKQFRDASRGPLDHVYADCSVDMGESAEGYSLPLYIGSSLELIHHLPAKDKSRSKGVVSSVAQKG